MRQSQSLIDLPVQYKYKKNTTKLCKMQDDERNLLTNITVINSKKSQFKFCSYLEIPKLNEIPLETSTQFFKFGLASRLKTSLMNISSLLLHPYQNVMQEINFQKLGESSCALCLNQVPKYKLQSCNCSCCKTCMAAYIYHEIEQGKGSLTCPVCTEGKLLDQEVLEFVNTESWKQYCSQQIMKKIDSDPNQIWCPWPDCNTPCFVNLSDRHLSNCVQCNSCQYKFCSLCRLKWHEGKACNFDRQLSGLNIKRCPKCFVPIEREGGCSQILCSHCDHIFCWQCLQSLEGDYLLQHYNQGACKGQSGHTERSLMWYRIQFVAIILGLGIIVLILSPLLLLIQCCYLTFCKLHTNMQP